MVTSDPEMFRFYSDKVEELEQFSQSESEFQYNIEKEARKLNEEIDLEEEDLNREISRLEDSEEEEEKEEKEEE